MKPIVPKRPVGVLLAGGESRRLGYDKATFRLSLTGPAGGRSLLEWGVVRMAPLVEQVLLADRGRFQEESRSLDVRRVDDGPGKGPAAGILGAARAAKGLPLLVLACDLPWVSASLLEQILTEDARADWIVARTDAGLEPLCALYRPAALDELASRVANGRFALYPLRELVTTCEIRVEQKQLLNLNTPQDIARLEQQEEQPDGDER